MMNKNKIWVASLTLLLISVTVGCRRSQEGALQVIGSTTVAPLVEYIADAYHREQNIPVSVQAMGSSVGVNAVRDGLADVGMSSRSLTELELETVEAHPVAIEAMAVIIHPSNPVHSLSMQQVHAIFTGRITNWREVGGDNREIIVISREAGSGARSSFEEKVGLLTKEKISLVDASGALIGEGTGMVRANVANNRHAVGYVTIMVVDSATKAVSIDGVTPTVDNVRNHLYPLAHEFFLLTRRQSASQEAVAFVAFALSPRGQQIVEEHGLVRVQ